MDSNIFFDAIFLIAALWAVAQGTMTMVWKPFVLHPIRDMFMKFDQDGKEKVWYGEWWRGPDMYKVLTWVFLGIAGWATISIDPEIFDVGRMLNGGLPYDLPFGLDYNPWPGALMFDLIMVGLGRYLHDFLTEKGLMPSEPERLLPKKEAVP